MLLEDDIKKFSNNDYYRSSNYVTSLWDLINENFIYVLGLLKEGIISIYFDEINITFVASNSNREIVLDRVIKNEIKHYASVATYIEASADIRLVSRGNWEILSHNSDSFFIDNKIMSNDGLYDDGEIYIEIDLISNFNDLNKIKQILIESFTKEYQVCINHVFNRRLMDRYGLDDEIISHEFLVKEEVEKVKINAK